MKDVRGVNLGGWLVLERWITPSVFSGVSAKDEYGLCKELGAEKSKELLERHRDVFITEEHIKRLAELGLNTLRLPVGYWLFGNEPPYVDGCKQYVDRCFDWAEKYNLKIILDIHAAPGSQNGMDHSGQSGIIGWTEPANQQKTLEFLEKLTEAYDAKLTLVGVEVLNEPHWDILSELLVEFYARADRIVRQNCPSSVRTIVHDSFRPKQTSKALRKAKLDVALDVHLYQLYTPEDRQLDLEGHIKKAEREWRKLLKALTKHHWVLVGEWSVAMYELYQNIDQPSRQYTNDDYQKYSLTQRQVFENAGANWTYWTARTEDAGPWSLTDHPNWL